MKILRLLNKKFLSILISFFLITGNLYSENEPVDIWNIDKSESDKTKENQNNEKKTKKENNNETSEINISNIESQDSFIEIELDKNLDSKKVKILGLYDPEDYGLSINMWVNSDGDRLKNIFSKLPI
ncbi:hypothetical protein IDG49_02835 [Pelagibacterales bacterium SAG-MED07]|nr:hypothetical protein [Pelagibacterales bacterium SAG-MED07]